MYMLYIDLRCVDADMWWTVALATAASRPCGPSNAFRSFHHWSDIHRSSVGHWSVIGWSFEGGRAQMCTCLGVDV